MSSPRTSTFTLGELRTTSYQAQTFKGLNHPDFGRLTALPSPHIFFRKAFTPSKNQHLEAFSHSIFTTFDTLHSIAFRSPASCHTDSPRLHVPPSHPLRQLWPRFYSDGLSHQMAFGPGNFTRKKKLLNLPLHQTRHQKELASREELTSTPRRLHKLVIA